MKKSFIPYIILITQSTLLYPESMEIGCNIISNKEESCEQEDIFTQEKIFKLDSLSIIKETPLVKFKKIQIEPSRKKDIIKITENLSFITVVHQKKSLKIEREATRENQSCPPNCIQPIRIENVETIGTLETLKFMDTAKKNRRMIIVDSRITSSYKKNTIPTATNIPNSILEKKSKHIDVILKLLGATKVDKKWIFNHVHTLLIFDNGHLDNQANKIIFRLIELGYPQNEILYYYGGIKDWTNAGLTTI